MAPAAAAQSLSPGDREQSRAQNRLGWEQMRGESYEQAVKHFQKAIAIDAAIPAWVSLSLGSAYFRSGQLADAEREYKATLEADTRSGEAHYNLAVVYLETGRIAEAEASLKDAKKAGFRVNPQLEQAIKKGQ